MGSAAWFSFAVIPIENNSEDYRKATILSDWKLWAVPWVVVEFCLGAGVLQTSNSRKWTKWVGSFCWPFCLGVTCCLTTTIWPPVRNLTVLVHVFVDKFVNIIPYKLNAKQTKNSECMCLSYNVFLNCNIALVYELICWNQCLMEKLWIEFMDLIIKHHK